MIDTTAERKTVKFPHATSKSFSKELRKRVNQYFKEHKLSKKANGRMRWKTVSVLLLYLLPFAGLFFVGSNLLAIFLLFTAMGIGMSAVGMGLMHDAVHGAYHEKGWVNRWLGSSIYLICGNYTTWKYQHNILHHTYTNIEGLDEDLETRGLIRLHPNQAWKKFHRAQMWYAPFLYGLLTLNWVVLKDFAQLRRYQKTGLARFSAKEARQEWLKLVLTKALYLGIFLVLPMIFVPVAPYWIVLGFVLMHFVAGFTLSFIFQLAHVVDHVDTFTPPLSGKMDDAWMEHQLRTTSNFARNNKLVGWFVGGLNFQVEHHLFPNICHIHYPALSQIVEKTAQEFGLPYNHHRSMREAVRSHLKSLKHYGQNPALN